MEICLSPVSGGHMPYQLSILEELGGYGYDCKMLLGASGGNMANYIVHAADFNPQKTRELAGYLNPRMFCSEWFPMLPLFSFICGYSEMGALYKHGLDNTGYFKYAFDGRNVWDRELWTAAYDIGEQKTQLFCNLSEETSMLGKFVLNEDIYQVCPNIYSEGDFRMLSKTVMASASIPGIVPPQKIGFSRYQDGGLTSATPMTLMRPLFENEEEIHLTYVGCEDLNAKDRYENVGNKSKGGLTEAREIVLRNIVANDRRTCYELVTKNAKPCSCGTHNVVHNETFYLNSATWKHVEDVKRIYKRSLIEIYPEGDLNGIDIADFKSSDIMYAMDEVKEKLVCKFWYV